MVNNQDTVIIIGRDTIEMLNAARMAGEAGWNVHLIISTVKTPKVSQKINYLPVIKSRYVKSYEYVIGDDFKQLLDVLINIGQCSGTKKALIPTNDALAEFVDLHLDLLSNYYMMPNVHNKKGKAVALMDKQYQKELARQNDIPVTNGCILEVKDGNFSIPDSISYPCFCKPDTSIPRRKKLMGKCNNFGELFSLIQRVADSCDCRMLVEDFVEIEEEYCMMGVAYDGNVEIPGILEKKSLSLTQPGVTLCGNILLSTQFEDTIEKLKQMIRATEFIGMFNLDMYTQNGVLYFSELNIRASTSSFALLIEGINPIQPLLKMLSGEKALHRLGSVNECLSYVNGYLCLNEYSKGVISWGKYRQLVSSADINSFFFKNDKGPNKYFRLLELKSRLKRAIKR